MSFVKNTQDVILYLHQYNLYTIAVVSKLTEKVHEDSECRCVPSS